MGPLGRSVCALCARKVGVRLSVDGWGPCYVRAKDLKWSNDDT
jgi:hypothetical protein